jgi:uncharacterized protein YcaQ
VAPSRLLRQVDEDSADRFMARKAVAFAGIGRVGPLSGSLARRVTKDEERRIERALVESGEIVRVEVEGWRGTTYVLAGDVANLRTIERGGVPRVWKPLGATTQTEITFLSPLDPVSARGRAKTLFDFDYVWEIYKKPAHVKFGRYTLPMLWGDQLVGRIDFKVDRSAKTLVTNGAWLEKRAIANRSDALEALTVGVRRTTVFLECGRVDAGAVKDRRIRASIASVGARAPSSRRRPRDLAFLDARPANGSQSPGQPR